MTSDILLYHMKELGVVVQLSADARGLELESPRDVLTPELIELLREHKGDLVESIYLLDEADAIAWEGCLFSDSPPTEDKPRFRIGALVFPCTPDGVLLHRVPSPIAEMRPLPSGGWQYRMEDFTQWRDEIENAPEQGATA